MQTGARGRAALGAAVLAAVATLAVPQAASARWSAPRPVPGAERAGIPYDVAVGADGTVAVAYLGPGGVRVVVRRNGRWLPPRTVSRRGGFGERAPRVAVDGSGAVLVVWVRTSSRGTGPTRGPYWIEARTRSRRGRWGAIRRLGFSGHFVATGLDVALNDRGDAVVVWRGIRKIGRRNLDAAAAVYRRAGRRFGAVRIFTAGAGAAAETAGAIDPAGNAHIVWTAGAHGGRPVIRYAHRSRTLGWSAGRTISAAPASRAAVAATGGRGAVVAWRVADIDSEGEGIQAGPVTARARSRAGRWSAPATVSTVPAHELALEATRRDGETTLVWRADLSRLAAPDDGLRWAVARAGAFGPVGTLDPGRAVAPVEPGLAVVGDRWTVAAWSAPFGADGRGDVRAAVRPAGAAFGPVETVSATGLYPRLGGGRDRAVAVWLRPGGDTPGLAWAQWLPPR